MRRQTVEPESHHIGGDRRFNVPPPATFFGLHNPASETALQNLQGIITQVGEACELRLP
jgi:hypothetical protein